MESAQSANAHGTRASVPFMQEVDKWSNALFSPYGMVVYEESCWRAQVLIVNDDSDEAFVRCTLQVLEDMSVDSACCALPVGTQFQYTRRRDVVCAGMARLIFE